MFVKFRQLLRLHEHYSLRIIKTYLHNTIRTLCRRYDLPDEPVNIITADALAPHSHIAIGYDYYTPRTTKLLGGILVSLRPSVRPSVPLSRLPCPLCNIYSSGWILSILATNDHYHERVCRTQ